MITSTAKEIIVPGKSEYPKLMKSIKEDLIVLFYSEGEGVAIHCGDDAIDDNYFVGKRSSVWRMEFFVNFYGEVVIKAENND